MGGGGGRGESARGTISRLFSSPIIPVSCLFYSRNTSTGNTEPDLKSPSPASLSHRSVIL